VHACRACLTLKIVRSTAGASQGACENLLCHMFCFSMSLYYFFFVSSLYLLRLAYTAHMRIKVKIQNITFARDCSTISFLICVLVLPLLLFSLSFKVLRFFVVMKVNFNNHRGTGVPFVQLLCKCMTKTEKTDATDESPISTMMKRPEIIA
jgi:hypothetical protein